MSRLTPSSILIVGCGEFGLSTAHALLQSPEFKDTQITVVDRSDFPASDGGSVDSSRIVRSDYSDDAYTELAKEALKQWRGDFGQDVYTESGFAVLFNEDGDPLAREWVGSMLENEMKLGSQIGTRESGADICKLNDREDVKNALPGFTGAAADGGYVNYRSGWAHAEDGLRRMRKLVESFNRVEFKVAEVQHLIFDTQASSSRVLGAVTTAGERLLADLTVVAAGAWSGRFVDLRGVASATGQPLAYLSISDDEQHRLLQNPVIINPSNYMYILQPRDNVLKISRHSYGWSNPQQIEHPEKPGSGDVITVSLPRTKHDDMNLQIPSEADKACRDYLMQCMPEFAGRSWLHTRICWYSDTIQGDWLIDYHPRHDGLFVATGGSGHAYKFLPVIGRRILEVITRTPSDELGKTLTSKWRWPSNPASFNLKWTDELRGGPKGMILAEELSK